MADAFKDQDYIVLQSGANIPLQFKFNACSGSTKNDGAIPYGSTLASSTILAYDEQGNAISTSLVTSRGLSSNIVTAYLTYTSTFVDGLYKLTLKNTYSLSGSTLVMSREHDFERILVGNI